MAHIETEIRNMQVLWPQIADRALIAVLVAVGMGVASFVAIQLGHAPQQVAP